MTLEIRKQPYAWSEVKIGTELGTFEYVLTQAQVDNYRKAVDDQEAPFTTLAVKHDVVAFGLVYDSPPGVNARNEVRFFHPPIPGKKIRVTARIVDKYVRRGLPYLVTEATAIDEDGRLIETIKTYVMQRTQKVGEKWQHLQR
jgi:hypothetical protein